MDLFLTCSVIQTPQIVPIIPGSNIHVLSIMSLDNPPPSSQNLLQDHLIFEKPDKSIRLFVFYKTSINIRRKKEKEEEKKREAAAEIEREIEREREKKEREGEGERER